LGVDGIGIRRAGYQTQQLIEFGNRGLTDWGGEKIG
jgi:hypothetical protein